MSDNRITLDMKKPQIYVSLLILICFAMPAWAVDKFEQIKDDLATAECVHLDFLSILESTIFEMTDTTRGSALIYRDGGYKVTLGTDIYLQTGDSLYSYSAENNQVLVEWVPSGAGSDEITFITRLDEFFITDILKPNLQYLLTLKGEQASELPDSMIVSLDESGKRIVEISYRDINEEFNRILLTGQKVSQACDKEQLSPDFPDKVEYIRF